VTADGPDPRQTSFALRLTLLTTALVTLCVGLCSAVVFVQVRIDLEDGVGRSLGAMAISAAPLLDGDAIPFIYREEDGEISEPEAFGALRAKLLDVARANELEEPAVILRPRAGQGRVRELEFVVMTDRDEQGQLYVGNVYRARPHHRTALGGKPAITEVYEDAHGMWMSAAAPIRDSEGAVVAVLQLNRSAAFITREASRRAAMLLLIALLTVAIGGVLASRQAGVVVRPIRRITEAACALGAGELWTRLPEGRTAELARLSAGFNAMADRLGALIGSVRDEAKGVRSTADALGDTSARVDADATALAELVTRVTRAARDGRAQSDEVSGHVTEITEQLEYVSLDAHEALAIVNGAVSSVEAAERAADSLITASRRVGRIGGFITGMVEQTHLLALNATIEANRSASGRAFRVVAKEVTELARQTGDAVDDIERQIRDVQAEAERVSEANTDVHASIRRVSAIVRSIALMVENQARHVVDVRDLAGAARDGSGRIAEDIAAVSRLAGSTTSRATEMRRAAADLRTRAQQLDDLMGQFRTEPAEARGLRGDGR